MRRITFGHGWILFFFSCVLSTMRTIEEAKQIWKGADAVCFDVDSTVIIDEGIDELAAFCGRGKAVSAWTLKAMGGGVSFRTALTERLNIIRPTLSQFEEFLRNRPPNLTPGVRELVRDLQNNATPVYLISGGFLRIVEPVAKELGIPKENIFTNRLLFDSNGDYTGFDKMQPTSDSGGKSKVLRLLKNKYGYKRLVMIGDGATDLEACPPADTFIGFGGNVEREKVRLHAPWFITDFRVLRNELQ